MVRQVPNGPRKGLAPMNRRILTPLAAIGVTLATASAAQAHTGDVVIGQPVISSNSCKIHAEFTWTSFSGRSDVGAQVNVDGSAKVEDIVTIVRAGRKGY